MKSLKMGFIEASLNRVFNGPLAFVGNPYSEYAIENNICTFHKIYVPMAVRDGGKYREVLMVIDRDYPIASLLVRDNNSYGPSYARQRVEIMNSYFATSANARGHNSQGFYTMDKADLKSAVSKLPKEEQKGLSTLFSPFVERVNSLDGFAFGQSALHSPPSAMVDTRYREIIPS